MSLALYYSVTHISPFFNTSLSTSLCRRTYTYTPRTHTHTHAHICVGGAYFVQDPLLLSTTVFARHFLSLLPYITTQEPCSSPPFIFPYRYGPFVLLPSSSTSHCPFTHPIRCEMISFLCPPLLFFRV